MFISNHVPFTCVHGTFGKHVDTCWNGYMSIKEGSWKNNCPVSNVWEKSTANRMHFPCSFLLRKAVQSPHALLFPSIQPMRTLDTLVITPGPVLSLSNPALTMKLTILTENELECKCKGDYLVSGSFAGHLYIWSVKDGSLVKSYQVSQFRANLKSNRQDMIGR